MRNTWTVVFLSVSILLCLPDAAWCQAPGGEGLEIGSVEVAGNVSVSKEMVLSKVRSRKGDAFSSERASEDARRVADELTAVDYSYYNKVIADNKVLLTFVVVERSLVRSIQLVGNMKIKDKKLLKKLDFKVGDHLSDIASAEAGRFAIEEYYLKKGYAFANVTLDDSEIGSGNVIYIINEGPRVKVRSVKFVGNKDFKSRQLKKVVKTGRKKMYVLTRYFSRDQLAKDLSKLQSVYYDRGYLNAVITEKLEFNEDKSRVNVSFEMTEGPVYRIERIMISGNEHFSSELLGAELKIKQGKVYNRGRAVGDTKRLLKVYREQGYVDVDIAPVSPRFVSENSVEVEFSIIEGDQFRIGRIDITGNKQVQEKVVRNVLDEYNFTPGQLYDAHMAPKQGGGELETRVQRMVLGQSVSITPLETAAEGQKNAEVHLVEGQTGQVMLGAGVASDSGLIGQVVYQQRNFDISDWPESWREFFTGRAFRGAGQTLRIALEPGTEVSEYSVSFSDPYLLDKPIGLDVVGSSWERGRESYDEARLKGYLGFEKRDKNRRRRSIAFRGENVDISDIDFDGPKEVKDDRGDNALFGVKFGMGRDLTNDVYYPTTGDDYRISYEQVGGDHTFGILSGTFGRYITIHEDIAERKTVLAGRIHGATTVGDAPVFEKFYAGGSKSIRGFDYRGVSTRGVPVINGIPQVGAEKKDPIGSDWMVLVNAEVIVPLVSENFSWLFFVDGGAIDSGNFRSAIGTGIQIMIPQWFGPVPMRFEIATPITKDDEDDVQVFSFSVGRLF